MPLADLHSFKYYLTDWGVLSTKPLIGLFSPQSWNFVYLFMKIIYPLGMAATHTFFKQSMEFLSRINSRFIRLNPGMQWQRLIIVAFQWCQFP